MTAQTDADAGVDTVRFTGMNLVCADVEETVAFYRLLGVDVPEEMIWRTASGAHHVRGIEIGAVCELELDSRELAAVYNDGYSPAATSQELFTFGVPTRDAVDRVHDRLVAAGHPSRQTPCDAFWGARFAIVADPDGRAVALTSAVDPARRSPGPAL